MDTDLVLYPNLAARLRNLSIRVKYILYTIKQNSKIVLGESIKFTNSKNVHARAYGCFNILIYMSGNKIWQELTFSIMTVG